jgi:purine-binding chemotaxis protein CheW
MSRTQTTTGQVLEFRLGEETYCVSIDYVTEIVDTGEVTTVPNAPPHITGVMDLRGQTTSIVDPKVVFGVDGTGDEQRIIVFDPEIIDDQGAAGWLVDEVSQVTRIDDGSVDEAPSRDKEAVNGVVKRDDGFLIWVDPEAVHSG